MTKRLAACIGTVCLLIGLGACGSSAKVDARGTTVGQELTDLEDARDRGLITESEYNKQRQKIMKRK